MRSKDTEINAAADNAYGLPVGGREAWADRFAGDPLLAALDFSTGVVRIDRARVPAGLLDNPIAAALLANYFRISENDWGKAGAVSVVGPELDGLADRPEPANWNILWHLNMAAMQAIAPRRRLAALLMARDEALHLSEWFAHAAAIGIEHVFVYTNDNSDGTDQLLDWFSHQGHATVIRMSIARASIFRKKITSTRCICCRSFDATNG